MTVHCVLCLNTSGTVPEARAIMGGYSVCDEHANPDLWMLNPDDSLNLQATIKKLKGQRAAPGAPT